MKLLRSRLGLDSRLSLLRLHKDKYLRLRMNARSLHARIVQRLRERRFELERLHQSFRNVLNGEFDPSSNYVFSLSYLMQDKKLANHIRSATKRRDPTIQKLTKTYNTLVAEIETLIRSGGAPRGARAPRPIAREGLFTLDVDNAIWEDDGPDDISTALWHCNEDVRRGIRYLLQQDRCIEEKKQLQKERSAIQHWFVEEWRSTQMALEASSKHYITSLGRVQPCSDNT